MKKLIFPILFIVLLIASCEIKIDSDIIKPEALISANVNGNLRTSTAEAEIKNGMLFIDTWDGLFGIDLYIEKLEIGEQLLGANQMSEALIYPELPTEIRASSNYNQSTKGNVVITQYNSKDSTVSGTFAFEALTSSGYKRVIVKDGKFENIKIKKYDNAFLNKLSYRVNGNDTKLRDIYGGLDSASNTLNLGGTRTVGSEGLRLSIPQSSFKDGYYDFTNPFSGFYSGSNNNLIFTKAQNGKFEIISLDTKNKIIKSKFNISIIGFTDTINITDGFLEIQYK